MFHTRHGLYQIDEDVQIHENLIDDEEYEVPDVGHISAVSAFDQYFFTALGTDIYYWDSDNDKARVLEGTYSPPAWQENTAYIVGDIVRPTNHNYSGYIYRCIQAGTSGSSETRTEDEEEVSMWKKDLSTEITDGGVKWIGVGSLEIEGSSASTFRAQCIDLYKGFLFVANTEEDGTLYPYRVRWSQWQNPRLWHNNDDGSGLSGYVDVDDTDGKIVAIKRLGDALYVYKERSIIAFTYTGGEDTVFSKEVITTKAGLISPEAIVELPHMHIFIGQDDVYMFDGNTCTPIGDPVKDWVYQNIKPDSTNKIFGYYNEETGDVTFSFYSTINEGDNCDKAIIYNISQRVWSTREMYMTAIGQYSVKTDRIINTVNTPYDEMNTTIIDSSLYMKDKLITVIGDENGKIYILEGYNDSRRDYEGYVISKTHHMDAPERIKRLMRIQFHIETQGNYNLYCQVGTGWNAETSQIEWTKKLNMNLQKPNPWYNHHVAPFVDVDLSARYFQIRFGTEHNGEPFKILGYTLYYQLRSDE